MAEVLVEPGAPMPPGAIVDFNSVVLAAQAAHRKVLRERELLVRGGAHLDVVGRQRDGLACVEHQVVRAAGIQ